MKQTIEEYLSQHSADVDTIQQAARLYVKERLNYISDEEIKERLIDASNDYYATITSFKQLESNSGLLETASLFILSQAWADQSEQERVKRVVQAAKLRLPIIDPSVLALVAMFGMMYFVWAIFTGAKSSESTSEKIDPDGSSTKEHEIKYYSSPLSALVKLVDLSKLFKDSKKDSSESK